MTRPVQTSLSSTAFYLFVLVNATMILRPAELIPSLTGLPIYEVLILAVCALAFQRMKLHFSTQALRQQPISMCVVGVWLAIVLSHLTHLYLRGTIESSIDFLKTLVYYGLFLTVIDSSQRFHRFLCFAAVMSTVMISLCVSDYLGLANLEFIQHVSDRDGVNPTGHVRFVERMRGTGIFSDPNDLSLLIVVAGVMCLYCLNGTQHALLRWGWLLPMVILAAGLFFTRSRGGMLAAGGAAVGFVLSRYGKQAATGLATLGICGLPLVSGRQGSFDLSSGTANERIQLWRDGISELGSWNLFFGVGQGFYSEYAGLVAHNSFVHAYVELGLFGGTMFLGCFFFPTLALLRLKRWPIHLSDPSLARFRPYLAALLGGWAAGLMSLSRCYVLPTYMILGIAAVYLNLLGSSPRPKCQIVYWDKPHVWRLFASSALLFATFYFFVNIFSD